MCVRDSLVWNRQFVSSPTWSWIVQLSLFLESVSKIQIQLSPSTSLHPLLTGYHQRFRQKTKPCWFISLLIKVNKSYVERDFITHTHPFFLFNLIGFQYQFMKVSSLSTRKKTRLSRSTFMANQKLQQSFSSEINVKTLLYWGVVSSLVLKLYHHSLRISQFRFLSDTNIIKVRSLFWVYWIGLFFFIVDG